MKPTCPKCGRTLHIWNWKQSCPSCGVNMIGYDLQSRLLRDADEAEAEFARVQPYFDRGKAAYVGSKGTVARLVCSFLPFAALLLPLVKLGGKSVNVVGAVQRIVETVKGGAALPDRPLAAALAAAALLAWTVLLLLARIALIAGSCSRPGRLRLYGADARMLLSAFAAIAAFRLFCRMLPAAVPTGGVCAVGWGAYVFLALLAALAAFDIALGKIGIPVQYKTCYIRGIPADEYFAMQAQTETPAIRI